ncbi:MAG: TSCPD domain-containing protein [Dialister sp.]|nr:TSCPD domain-containing protein [Dialister sp.]
MAAIGKLLEGRSAKEAADILLGNTCRDKQTSCADQLAHALIEAMKKGNQE